jgi:hypothetical protein
LVSGGGAEGKESKKERKARKRMLKKQQEKEEGMDKLSKKQKSKIRSKAMVGTIFFTRVLAGGKHLLIMIL